MAASKCTSATSSEAALFYARAAAAHAASSRKRKAELEEAVRLAEAEGLTLLNADNISGYKGLCFASSKPNLTKRLSKPHEARVRRGGKQMYGPCRRGI